MDAERKAEYRKNAQAHEFCGSHYLLEALDALDAAEARVDELRRENDWMRNAPLNSIWAKRIADAEARAERAEAEWDRVGVCDTCDNLSEDLLDADGHEQCTACTELAAMTAERDRLRQQLDDAEARAEDMRRENER